LEKLLFIALVVAALWWFVRIYGKPAAGRRGPSPSSVEDMVRCAHCGVHVPRSESYSSGGEFFCSEEHLRLRR